MYRCDVPALMTAVIAYTRDAIEKYIGAHPSLATQHGRGPFWRIAPLSIAARSGNDTMVGFKVPWSKRDAETAIDTKAMYAAPINLDWVRSTDRRADASIFARS